MRTCSCKKRSHHTQLIVITGGPGAGKTAVLELARRKFCEHVKVLPEAASIVFGGGFPREQGLGAQKASQRAIYRVQHELEQYALSNKSNAIALCDRGTLDGIAYWPEKWSSFYGELETSEKKELKKYSAIIHLRPPTRANGYNKSNPVRIESAAQAKVIDNRIEKAWKHHPHRHLIEATDDFLEKASAALNLIDQHLPDCCR